MSHPFPQLLWRGAALLALLLTLIACSSQPTFTVDYADDADFNSFRSYRWYDDIHGSELAEYRQYNSSDKRVRPAREHHGTRRPVGELPHIQRAADAH